MGKNYVENSLKRFLKRKVKITLGFVVAFMISGTLGFAENTYDSKEWLAGIGSDKGFNSLDEFKIMVDNTPQQSGEIEISVKIENGILMIKDTHKVSNSFETVTTEIALNDLSNTTFENIKTTVENIGNANREINLDEIEEYVKYKDIEETSSQTANGVGAFAINKSNITSVQSAKNGGTALNYGEIKTNAWGLQSASNDSKAYNFGDMIVTGWGGQLANNNSDIFNYGTISGNGNGTGNLQMASNASTAYNYGTIRHGFDGQLVGNGSVGFNYGKIMVAQGGQSGNYSKDKEEGSTIYNYGIITANHSLQKVDENSGAYNYGLLFSQTTNGSSVIASNNSEIYNYGIMIGVMGQRVSTGSKADNYGIIANTESPAQHIESTDKNELWNHGTIKNIKYGQYIEGGNENNAYNYGVIANSGDYGQVIGENATNSNIYNCGIVANAGSLNMQVGGTNNIGYNYGVLVNSFGNATKGNVINNGIIIATDKGTGEMTEGGTNNGVIYNKTSNTFKTDTANTETIDTNKNLSEMNKNNIFVDNSKENSNATLTLDKNGLADNTLTGKHITTIVGDKSSVKTVVKASDDLTLDGSSIVGYFEKNGTLLNVNGSLTLQNGSIINAIAGNKYTGFDNELKEVVAVSLTEGAELVINDNSNVLGAVKGNGVLVLKNFNGTRNYSDEMHVLEIKTTKEKGTNATLDNFKTDHGIIISGHETSKDNTRITFGNVVNIKGGLKFDEMPGEMLGADITLGDGQIESDGTINIDSISLGSGEDILTIQNALGTMGEIDGRDGEDIVNLKNLNGNHDTFDYALKNVETLDLNNQTWKIGENASINDFGNTATTTKANNDKITIQNGTLMGELKGDKDTGASFENSTAVDSVLGNSTFGDNAKFQMGIGAGLKLEAGAEYDMDKVSSDTLANLEKLYKNGKLTVSSIFGKGTGDNEFRIKNAKEIGINDRYSEIYNQMLENADKEEVRDVLNSVNSSDIADVINSKGAMVDTLATSGYKITRDISNSFISSVNEWNKKANKGEWLANAKYINSDVEYDGANSVKGYDSDITSMVGMIEYGVSDNTSYGVALGGGDTEVDVTGAGTLEGDNYYIGAYAKHSVNGFDLVGNLGYTISDLEVDGNGSADSSAITFAGYVKRDIRLSETIKIEPNLAFTYDYIMQDDAEGNGVKVENKDIHVFEATAGMNIVKEFALNNGNLELKAGIKYSMADINRNEETIMVSVLSMENTSLGNPEVDKTRGTAHIGFDYEHETGFGVNGKYETMWSDSGDDSRITAGVSYRF